MIFFFEKIGLNAERGELVVAGSENTCRFSAGCPAKFSLYINYGIIVRLSASDFGFEVMSSEFCFSTDCRFRCSSQSRLQTPLHTPNSVPLLFRTPPLWWLGEIPSELIRNIIKFQLFPISFFHFLFLRKNFRYS